MLVAPKLIVSAVKPFNGSIWLFGVMVAGDLRVGAGDGLVAEGKGGGGEGLQPFSTDAVRRRRVVVALDPDEAVRLGHRPEPG